MSKLKVVLIFLISAGIAACGEKPSPSSEAFVEATSLAALPAAIKANLQVSAPGLEGVAEKGSPFNATDRIEGTLPGRRFLAAARKGDLWLVAIEQGGRGYSVQVSLFSEGGVLKQRWDLLGRPTTLHDVLEQIPAGALP